MIVENLAALTEAESQLLLISMATMRLNEAQYRNTRDRESTASASPMNFSSSTPRSMRSTGIAEAKERLDQQVQTYVDAFSDWALAASRVRPWVASIDSSSEQMLPDADKIIASAARPRGRCRDSACGVAGVDAQQSSFLSGAERC